MHQDQLGLLHFSPCTRMFQCHAFAVEDGIFYILTIVVRPYYEGMLNPREIGWHFSVFHEVVSMLYTYDFFSFVIVLIHLCQ